MPTYQEQSQQHTFDAAAQSAVVNDPRLRGIINKIAQTTTGKPMSALSKSAQENIMLLASAAVNSLGAKTGIEDAGDTFANVYEGAIGAGGIPITGGVGSSRIGFGSSYGAGNNQVAIAAQVHGNIMQDVQTGGGGMDLGITRGLSSTTISQMVGQQMRTRQWKSGDVTGADFGDSLGSMDSKMNELVSRGMSTGSTEYKKLREVRDAVAKRSELRKQGNSAEDIDMKMGLDKTISASANEMAKRQEKGSMHGVYATESVRKEMLDGIKASADNVKQLGDIFGTQDFKALQANAQALGMGSLTAKKNVADVKQRIERANVQATMTGRSVQEVFQEQADLISGMSTIYGGAKNVPVAEVERIQNIRGTAIQAREKGYSVASADDVTAEATRSTANAAQLFKGLAFVEQMRKDRGGTLTGDEQKKYDSINKRFSEATAAGDRDAQITISREAEILAEAGGGRTKDKLWALGALKNSSSNLTEASIKTAAVRNLDERLSSRVARGYTTEGSGLSQVKDELGDDESGTKLKGLSQDILSTYGGNATQRNEFFKQVGSIRGIQDAEEKKKALDVMRQDMKATGVSAAVVDTAMKSASTMASMSDIGFKTTVAEMNGGMDNAQARQLESSTDRAARSKISLQNRATASLEEGTVIKSGTASQFIGGLLADGGLTAEAAMSAKLFEGLKGGKSISKTLGTDGIQLGKTDHDGRLVDRAELLKNKAFLNAMGATSDEAKAKLAAKMETAEGTDEIFNKLDKGGSKVMTVGKEWVAVDDARLEKERAAAAGYGEKHGLNGLGDVFGKGNVAASESGIAIGVGTSAYTSVPEALKAVLKGKDPKKLAALKKAEADGNVYAKDALKTARMGLIDKIANGSEDGINTERAQAMGFANTQQYWAWEWNAKQEGDLGAVKQRLYGTDNLDAYSSMESLKAEGLVEDGKITRGQWAGKDADDAIDKMKPQKEALDAIRAYDGGTAADPSVNELKQIRQILDARLPQ